MLLHIELLSNVPVLARINIAVVQETLPISGVTGRVFHRSAIGGRAPHIEHSRAGIPANAVRRLRYQRDIGDLENGHIFRGQQGTDDADVS